MKPVPPEKRSAVPYLFVKGAAAAIEFYKAAFGATEEMRMDQPDGRVGHADLRIGQAAVMLADEFPELDVLGPQTLGGSAVAIHIYVDDVDALVARAAAAGATVKKPPSDQFYGDRSAELRDPFGHRWLFASIIEELSREEIKRRAPS